MTTEAAKKIKRIGGEDGKLVTTLFENLFNELKEAGAPSGKVEIGVTGYMEGIEDWGGSYVIAGKDVHGRRYIGVKTAVAKNLMSNEGAEEGWFLLWDRYVNNGAIGTYGGDPWGHGVFTFRDSHILTMRELLQGNDHHYNNRRIFIPTSYLR